jgi:hypothetical protein
VVASSGRSQASWALALGLSRQSFNDRMRFRTAWTLADAIALAEGMGIELDQLVGSDDMPIGFVTADAPAEVMA